MLQVVFDTICREEGVFHLNQLLAKRSTTRRIDEDSYNYLIDVAEADRALDFIELLFRAVVYFSRTDRFQRNITPRMAADDAIEELNARFLENAVGYRFESSTLIRVDSQFLHQEVIKPALVLLADQAYQTANAEFLKGHEHYRHGRYAEALADAAKAFESTLKIICDKRSWAYDPAKATAKALLDVVYAQGLIPTYQQGHFAGVRSALEGGVPTVRNKTAAHGAGSTPIVVPPHLAAFGLQSAAAAILLLIESERALPT